MPAYGIDTSVFVRVLTGLPAVDYQTTIKRLAALRAAQAEHITVANIVIAEAYAVLQHHYALSKADARAAILSALTSGLIEPADGARLPVSICMVVVLPAPLGPRKPRISPRFNSRLMSSTTVCAPKRRDSPWAETVISEVVSVMHSHIARKGAVSRLWRAPNIPNIRWFMKNLLDNIHPLSSRVANPYPT